MRSSTQAPARESEVRARGGTENGETECMHTLSTELSTGTAGADNDTEQNEQGASKSERREREKREESREMIEGNKTT